MFFKRKCLIFILSVFALSSCRWIPGSNLSIGEKNPPPGHVEVDMSRFTCLRDLGKNINDYFNSNLNSEQITGLSLCIRSALSRFEFLTKDSADGSYTPNSLVNFLNREYLHEQKISQSFAQELMAIKTLILGGSDERINRTELHELAKLIIFLEQHAIAHLPYIKIYMHKPGDPVDGVSKADLLNAREQVRSTGRDIAELFRKGKNSYSLQAFSRLLNEIRIFSKWEESRSNTLNMVQIMDIVRAFKELITGDASDIIKPKDWLPISDAFSVVYGLLLNHEVSLRGQKLTIDPALDTLIESINDSLMLLERIIKIHPEQVIRFEVTNKLVTSLFGAGKMPEGLRESSIINLYKHLISHAFQNPSRPLAASEVKGLGLLELKELRSEFNLWAGAQKFLSDNAEKAFGLSFDPTDEVLEPTVTLMNSLDFSRHLSKSGITNVSMNREIESIIRHLSPFYKSGDRRAFIASADELSHYGVQHGLHNLTQMNFMRAMVRLLMRSFAAKSRAISMAGITEQELEQFYQTVKPLGEDLKFMDPRRSGGGSKYFIEGNMFSRIGDGITGEVNSSKDLLSFYETMDLLSMMLSGGEIRTQLYNSISEKCIKEGYRRNPVDVYNIPKIQRECFVRHFYDNRAEEFSNLPNLLQVVRELPKEEFGDLIINLQSIAKIKCEDSRYIESSEIATISTALHYTESVFSVYDQDKNNTLEAQEIMSAFPRFNGYLERQISEQYNLSFLKKFLKSVDMRKAIYAFLIKNQMLPTAGDFSTLLWYKWWYFNDDPDEFRGPPPPVPNGISSKEVYAAQTSSLPEMSADRIAILKVLGVLAEVSRKATEGGVATGCH